MTSFLKNVRESLTPTLKTSAFSSRGVLTPEEFVKAGDELVFKCPTWAWEAAADESKERAHLPKNKQYLVTRNVPCRERCSAVEKGASGLGMMKVVDGDWMVEDDGKGGGDDDFDFAGDDVEGEKPPAAATPPAAEEEENDDDEYADISDFQDSGLAKDAAALTLAPNSNVLAVRTYDVMISYDKYYQTPRVWLSGYSESGSPLHGDEMFEDCMSDYVKRTVTIESFPFTSAVVISIHPCQHGNVMKNIVSNMQAAGGEVKVEAYMFVFLKFVSSMIPTINYDFTTAVEADTSKKK